MTEIKNRSLTSEAFIRLKKNRLAMLGMVIFVGLLLVSAFAPLIVDYETQVIGQNARNRLQPPSGDHWFGTDEFGRDVFARIIYGSRISLYVGILSVSISLTFGGMLGSMAGFYGGKIDSVIMRFMDMLLALPSILLAITIVAALGTSIINIVIAIAIADIAVFSRVVRAAVITVKDEEYIEAAKSVGANDFKIIAGHILPNCFAPIIVQATFKVASSILAISGLSFIGLGIEPPTPEWGNMLASARAYYRDSNYLILFPGSAIILTILSLNLLGDGIRDALDPKLK